MIKQLTISDFRTAFKNVGRHNSWGYEGLEKLFEYLEELESCCETPIELDVVGLDCEFCEYTSKEQACNDLGIDEDDSSELDDYIVAEWSNGIIIRNH